MDRMIILKPRTPSNPIFNPKPPTNLLCPLGIRVRLTCHILIVLLISGESICVLALERGELIVWDVLLCCEFGVAVYLNADFG
jgi:hypothetical protein